MQSLKCIRLSFTHRAASSSTDTLTEYKEHVFKELKERCCINELLVNLRHGVPSLTLKHLFRDDQEVKQVLRNTGREGKSLLEHLHDYQVKA